MTDETKLLIERARRISQARHDPGTLVNPDGPALADALEAATARAEKAEAEIVRLTSDRQYIVGWNDGFTHVHGELRFPTMLRKMWSGGEVQRWLDEQRIEAARAARSDNGAALVDANARADALERKFAAAREALEPLANYAWSGVSVRDDEARTYLQSLIDNARAALALIDNKDGE